MEHIRIVFLMDSYFPMSLNIGILDESNWTKQAVICTYAPVLPVESPANIAAVIPISLPKYAFIDKKFGKGTPPNIAFSSGIPDPSLSLLMYYLLKDLK